MLMPVKHCEGQQLHQLSQQSIAALDLALSEGVYLMCIPNALWYDLWPFHQVLFVACEEVKQLLLTACLQFLVECNEVLCGSPVLWTKELYVLQMLLIRCICLTHDKFCCPCLEMFTVINVFVAAGGPKLNRVVEVLCNQCRAP